MTRYIAVDHDEFEGTDAEAAEMINGALLNKISWDKHFMESKNRDIADLKKDLEYYKSEHNRLVSENRAMRDRLETISDDVINNVLKALGLPKEEYDYD